jgi:hypothetical protein
MGANQTTRAPAIPPPPNIPRAPTMLDPAVELARLTQQRRTASGPRGFTSTALTRDLGGVGGSNLPRLTGH